MRKYNKGDIVLSKIYEVNTQLTFDTSGLHNFPYIETKWFNRRAYISKTQKEAIDKALGGENEDTDKYEITFLDNGDTLAWVNGDDLILVLRNA